MTLKWYYSIDASTVQEWTDRIELPIGDNGQAIGVGSHADAGSGWEGDIYVNDPGGTLARPKAYRRIYAVQDAAPAGAQVVGNWFISGVKVRRMDPWSGAARRYVVTMADENSLLSRRKWTGANANRPSESDIVRIRWALLETELNVLSPDETYIDTTNPVTLEASDLRDSSPEDMMMTIFQRTGKEHWVKYEEAAAVGGAIVSSSVANPTVITTTSAHGLTTGQTIVIAGHSGSTPTVNGTHVVTVTGATTYTIPVNVTVGGTGGTSTTVGRYVLCYFNPNTSTLLPSTVSISNDPADTIISADNPTSLVYPLGDDAELDGTGGRFSSGLIVPHLGASKRVYVQYAVAGDEYAYVDNVSRPPIAIKTAAEATLYANRQLPELATPDDEVTTPIWVQEARLNLVKAGMIVAVHSTYFPNFTDDASVPGWEAGFVDCRVKKRIVTQGGPTTFRLDLTLSPMQSPLGAPLWANIRAGVGGFGIDPASAQVTEASPGFIDPVGGVSVVPGDDIAALFVLAWNMQGIAGTGQVVVPDPPADPVMMIANTAPPTPLSDYEAGFAEMIIDPTSGDYTFTGNAGGAGRDGVSTLACFPAVAGSPYSRVQSAIANGTVTLGAPATAGNLLILAIAGGAPQSYFPGFVDTDTPDIPEQSDWTAVAPTSKLDLPHLDTDYWPALRMYYKVATGGETVITYDDGPWPYSSGMVVEYAP